MPNRKPKQAKARRWTIKGWCGFYRGRPALYSFANTHRAIQQQFQPTPELMRMFGDKLKMFRWATVAPDGTLDLYQEAPWQNW